MPAPILDVSKARWLALVLSAGLTACLSCNGTPEDPLAPEAIDDAAKAEGDAAGSDRSGRYLITLTRAPDCDCPTVYEMDLCRTNVNALATAGGEVTLTQTDGYLLLTEDMGLLTLSGALDATGEFDIAAIHGFGSVLGEVALYMRLVGEFTDTTSFTGTVQSRALGEFDGQQIDCRTEAEVSGVRRL